MRARAVLASAAMLLLAGCAATGNESATTATPTAETSASSSMWPADEHSATTTPADAGNDGSGDSGGEGTDDGDGVAADPEPSDADSPEPPTVVSTVVVHDGGESEVTVTAEGARQPLGQLKVSVATAGPWAQSPARLGPVVSTIGAPDSVTLRLRYPAAVAGGLTADGLILAVDDDRAGTLEFVVLEHDPDTESFTAELSLAPHAAIDLVLLDLEAYQVLGR